VTMARLRWYALTAVGGLFIVWELINAMCSYAPSRWDLVAILIIIPMYAVGAWLTWRLPTHPQAVRLLVCGTAIVVGMAGWVGEWWPWTPVLSALSMEAGAVALLAMTLLIGSFPDGLVERRWQRLALRCSWVILLGAPLALLASPVLPVSSDRAIPNPYAVSWLAWLAQPAAWLALHYGWVLLVGVLVLCARFVTADAAGRAQLRVIFVVVLGLLLFLAGTVAPALGAPEDSALVVTLYTLGSLTLILLPGAIIYGILRRRLIDLDLVVRKSVAYGGAFLLIAATYALSNRVPVTLAVTVTVAAALAFQPLRRRLESAVSRRLFGDRVRQYQLLTNLGTTMEQTAELDELLPRLAHAVRDGIGASWVQVRLRDADDSWLDDPIGVAGEVIGGSTGGLRQAQTTSDSVAGEVMMIGKPKGSLRQAQTSSESAAAVDLVRAGDLVGRIDLGPKVGGYAAADLELLATVAAQATTAVANVRLATQLKEGLEQLSTSRVRLIAAQDAERRRIERDLHDGIQQEVVALIAGLRLARNRLSRDQLTADELTELQDQAREMLRDLRELAHGIHPPVLSDNGLVAALESRVSRFPIPVEIIADDGLRNERLPEDVEGTAYFVACESLTNVAKHAGTDGARIRLSRFSNLLCLAVEDSGRGFQPNGARSGGLANIRDRVEALHGRLTIESQVGAGTSIRAELPLAPRSADG
jgi:signal transduction histidine kinase